MRSKIFALSKNEDFKTLITKKKISNKYVTIFFGNLVNKNNRKLNISFVVKKKIGNAVMRNKAKRRLRNIIHNISKDLKINLNYSYLLIVKKNLIQDKYQNVKNILYEEFNNIK